MRVAHLHCVSSRVFVTANHPLVAVVLEAISLLPLSGVCSNTSAYISHFFHQNLNHMKRMSFQLSVKALLVAFCMVGGFVAVTETSAQSGTTSAYSVASTVSLVDVDQATVILRDQVTFYHTVLPNHAPGSASYIHTVRRLAYYKDIVHHLGEGKTVVQAISLGLTRGATLGGTKEVSFTTKTELAAIYNEVVSLLTL